MLNLIPILTRLLAAPNIATRKAIGPQNLTLAVIVLGIETFT
jgi:hypothetical protein